MAEQPNRTSARASVCAVFVTYHPDAEFAERLGRVLPQVAGAVIVDNGSSDAAQQRLRALARDPAVAVISNAANLGIATALNRGVKSAAERGSRWALLLDQDTWVDPDMVERLFAALASCGDAQRVAAIGSRFRDTAGHSVEPIGLDASGEEWQAVESVITSGTLLSLAAFAAIGPFRDEFFIDHVDTEFCFRARAAGYLVIATLRPLMSHTVGAPTAHRLFGSTTWTSNHPPDRRYYLMRNDTVLLREYGTSGGGPWQWKSLIRCLRACKRIAYFERDKGAKIQAVVQGWWDGMHGRLGPRPPARRESGDL